MKNPRMVVALMTFAICGVLAIYLDLETSDRIYWKLLMCVAAFAAAIGILLDDPKPSH